MASVADITYTLKHEGTPLPVVIVQDKKSLSELIGLIGSYFLSAWVLMLLIPIVFPEHPLSYWQSAALFLVANTLFKTNPGTWVRLYTRQQK